ncbi:PLxRFG domain-containing protein [Paracoccus sp. Z330]|uniref:PLxRFG domain-containing protein n=1 Tax=Paracoccus onchidii TaxID=3017813 RepID=A0ABT4ZJW9_9RHOB|nr:PLxRFG domain-containing protein [Paracoccus onchidii]MDB6179011.1 PLxRFG domain-containing protein [Paracoccus onchidii]
MDNRVPGTSPLQSALSQLGATPEPAKPENVKDAFDGIARNSKIPANVLIALDEVAGGKGSVEGAQRNAAALSKAVQSGMSIQDAITQFSGDGARASAILDRSYEIADQMYPQDTAPAQPDSASDGRLSAGEVAGGLGRDVATGAVRGVGSGIRAAGVAADEMARFGDESGKSDPTLLRKAGAYLGDAVSRFGEGIAEGRTQDYKDKRDGTQIGGSLADPSSWTLGEDPSLIGLLGVAAEGAGSMLPMVAAPGPRVAAVFGGLMAGGEGVDNGRKFVEDAAKTLDENGRPEIEKLPTYQELTGAGGMSPEDAVEEVARRAENNAGFRQGLFGSLGGAATNRIMRGADGWLGKGGRLTKAVKKSAAGAAEEGTQEAFEGAASQSGINAATGAETDILQDSFGNFVAGGLAGGGMGAVSGALGGGSDAQQDGPIDPETGEVLALPAPDAPQGGPLVSAPRLIEQDPNFSNLNRPEMVDDIGTPIADGSGDGQAAAPDGVPFPPDQGAAATGDAMGALPPPAAPAGLLPPPAGPIEAIAQGLAQNMPQPEPEFPPLFPDQKPGGAVRLGNPASGNITDAVFMGETPEGMAQVRINGAVVELTPEEFDGARNAVTEIEAAQKAGNTGGKADVPTGSTPEDIGSPEGGSSLRPTGDAVQGIREPASTDGDSIGEGSERGQEVHQGGMPGRTENGSGEPDDLGSVALGVQPGKLGNTLASAKASGTVQHVTKKGKTKTGYVLKGVTKEQADQIDPYSFKKDGGYFVNQARADAFDDAGALNGEISTPDQVQAEIEQASGIKVSQAPIPSRAPWHNASADVRQAILDEAGPQAVSEYRRAGSWSGMSDAAKRAVIEANSRLYRAGAINNTGTIEQPNYTLSQPQKPASISQAAQDAATDPTDGQKEAGNYRKGHARWNGLEVSIENAKGSTRSGTDPSGEAWSVTMPADYGDFKGTKGADGDPVDFYNGGVEDSDYVLIVDQVDAETGKFDEHKVIIGTTARGAALKIYRDGFSDGKGDARIGAITETTVDGLKAWLGGGQMRRPAAGKLDYPFKRRANIKKKSEQAAPKADGKPVRTRPNIGDPNYTLIDAMNDLQDAEAEYSAQGMVKNARTGERMRQLRDLVKKMQADADKLREESQQQAEPPKASAPGLLGSLSQEKQDRAAELKARLAAKARGQASSGLDPEYITLGGELVSLYIEAGTKRFGQMLRDFAETTGLTLREAQAPMRAAYNHVRDDMDLNGEDVSDMDDGAAVMVEVRAALAEEDGRTTTKPATTDAVKDSGGKKSPPPAMDTKEGSIKKNALKSAIAVTARGREIPVQYAIVELGDLIPSQLMDGRSNPEYDQRLQPRDRSREASQDQIHRIARDLNPELLGESPQASNGAPIILPTGEVLSGNGRTLALQSASMDWPVSSGRYSDFIRDKGYPVKGMSSPVLVRIVTGSPSMQEAAAIAREANERDQAEMSISEQAMADAQNLTPAILDLYQGGDVDGTRNASFVRAFAQGVLSPNDAGKMRDKDGRMTQDAVRRINAALLASAYGDAGIVASVLESTDTNIKAIGGALMDVAPRWAQMRAEAKKGTIAADADMTPALMEAVKLVDRARRENRHLTEFLNQTDMFSGDSVSPDAVAILGLMYRGSESKPFSRPYGRDKVADALNFFVTEAMKTSPGVDLIGESADIGAIIQSAGGRINGEGEGQQLDLDGGTGNSGQGAAQSGEPGAGPENQQGETGVRGQGGSSDAAQDGLTPDGDGSDRSRIASAFYERWGLGNQPSNIRAARAMAQEVLGRTPSDKEIEEGIEAGIVRAARQIVDDGRLAGLANEKIFDALVSLYQAQPLLTTRTSTSVEQQAYSTPAPLAYAGSVLSGISGTTTVYEPSAGNGMLLIGADPANVTANELNDDRFGMLQEALPGAVLNHGDGTQYDPETLVDRVIANPPFGKVKDGRKSIRFPMDGVFTTEIDHAISWKALQSMKPTGRAVLIIGGHQGSAADRAKAYMGRNHHPFMTKLYDQFNVTDHFTVDGKMYQRQGAGWPVDVIVIEGKGKSALSYPYVKAPRMMVTWGEVRKVVENAKGDMDAAPALPNGDGGSAGSAGTTADQGPVSQPSGKPSGSDVRGGKPGGSNSSGVGSVRGGSSGSGSNAGNGSRGELDGTGQSDESGRGDVPDQSGQDATGSNGRSGNRKPDAAGNGGRTLQPVKKVKRENTEEETGFQVQYSPHSNAGFAVGTLVPRAMQSAADDALSSLRDEVGDIDQFVADKLGYPVSRITGSDGKPGYFSAEQVDALALAIKNIEDGAAFIIGDQTGVGKGRVVAGVLLYAKKNGRFPVFVTKQPGLFADMVRDLRDIGEAGSEKRILSTKDLRGANVIPLSNEPGDVLETESAPKLKSLITGIAKTGRLPDGYDYFFTTYSQMQWEAGSAGQATYRQTAMRSLASNAVMILDESHEAGGTEQRKVDPETGEIIPTRADFFRDVLSHAHGVMYSSATYAKNPTVMSLYNKTDMRLSVDDMSKLPNAVKAGGVPLQQVIANMLVKAGQYMRRERSFAGVEMSINQLETDKTIAKSGAKVVQGIFRLDLDYMEDARERFQDELASSGMKGAQDNSTGSSGAGSVGFSSVMHNLVAQMLFALKSDAVATRAIDLWKNGEKPLIAVSNTNESILSDFIDGSGIGYGDKADFTFKELFLRYLNRLRRVTLKDADGKAHHVHMKDDDILRIAGPDALSAVKDMEKQIAKSPIGGMPGSPLDYIMDRMRDAGMKVGEITGRGTVIEGGILKSRKASDAEKKKTMNAFNSGAMDGVLLNQSGSTGFSLHATANKGNDGKQRHMIVLQPDPNIDVFMQMLGRIHRTGQIKLPKYTIAISDLAIEKRVAANLMRKMASLNANTTANKDSAVSLNNVIDFMNKYGDEVVNGILKEDSELSAKLGIGPAKGNAFDGIASKFTGRLAVLDPDEVSEIYDRIEGEYKALIETLDRMGLNTLEAKTLDLEAQTISTVKLSEGDPNSSSPFEAGATMETVSAKRLGKPFTLEQLSDELAKEMGEDTEKQYVENAVRRIRDLIPAWQEKQSEGIRKAETALSAANTEAKKKAAEKILKSRRESMEQSGARLNSIIENIRQIGINRSLILRMSENGMEVQLPARSIGFDMKSLKDNPTAASAIRVRIAVADAAREVLLPLSKLIDPESPFDFTQASAAYVDSAFENGLSDSREERSIITGNLLSGFSKFQKGQVVMFTREDGRVESGILMPKNFDLDTALAEIPVKFDKAQDAIKFLREGDGQRMVSTDDKVATIKMDSHGAFVFDVKKIGGKPYYLNKGVRDVLGEFTAGRSGKGMFTARTSSPEKAASAAKAWQDQIGATLETTSFKDEAREITGEELPETKESRFDNDRPVVATLTGDELGEWADIRDLGRKAFNWYRENLVATTTIMNGTGWSVGYTRRGAGKISGRKGEDLLRLVPAIPAIIERGQHVRTEQNRKDDGVKAYHKIAARVELGGRLKDVIVTIREMNNGTFHYDLSRDNSEGALFQRMGDQSEMNVAGSRPSSPIFEVGARAASPANINIEISEAEINGDPTLTPANARAINTAARAELVKVGISGRVRVEVGGNGRSQGTYRRGVIRILRAGKDWKHTLDHEIIHALRDGNMWNKDYGLFTADEWRSLVKAARADKAIRDRVTAAYPDLSAAAQAEEMVAEFYADWAQGRRKAPQGGMTRALGRIRSFFRAVASALRGEGFQDAATIMERIANGEIGGRGPDGPGGGRDSGVKEQRDMTALRGAMQAGRAKAAGLVSREFWQKSPEMFSNWLTDAMGANSRFNILGMVPGHPLFAELGKNISAAQAYLRNKQEMDAMRNDWQARASSAVDKWHSAGRKDPASNDALMDLMHRTTLSGIDPSKPDDWKHPHETSARAALASGTATGDAKAQAQQVIDEIQARQDAYEKLKRRYDAMPANFQKLYRDIRDEYSALADATDKALLDNIETANRIALKRAERRHRQEIERIRDEGLEGDARDQALEKADARLAAAQKRAGAGKAARLASMRAAFEQNRLKGPYFPLARFGNYFVTVRDDDGKVVSFSRFEKKAQMDAALREWADHTGRVEHGVLGAGADLRGMVDAKFVSDVIETIGEAGASDEMLDTIWQHWLETLPDQSVRKSQIHRKGRAGFNRDAIRAFSHSMFHGAHQLARLKYGLEMDENLNDAEEQAARQRNPERAGFVVREMRQRHEFTMKPTNNPLVTAGTSLAFVWYLGMSPASAMVNLSQTTIVGVPMMAARFKKAGVTGSADALWKALQDFGKGKGHIDKAPSLTADEKAAMAEAYRRGTIDKTQAHDLAAVAESGVAYNPAREKAMRVIGYLFHHTERFNREVTFLANYRLLKAEGKNQQEAIEEADSLVKKIHFDYQNTARPRVMQGDAAKMLLVFRNFTVNMLYRLFRDTHQAFNGESKAAQKEARDQLVGVTLSMMAHAGIKGVWGYGLIMGLLGMFYPGGDGDDLEEWLQDALLMEGDTPATAAWNWTMGMALNGVPGNVLGVSLTNRIGMPNLWFQPPRAGTEGRDVWTHYLEQIAGPVAAIPGSFLSGMSMISDAWGEGNGDNMMRGLERATPGFIGDIVKPVRMMTHGANTYYGDPLIDNVSVLDAFRSALGFTPAKLAERYDINNRLKAKEKEITSRRARIHKAIGDAMSSGEDIPDRVMKDLQKFNSEYPEYPITPETARASIRSRARMKERNEFGVSLNPKLNDRIRSETPPAIYG